MKSSRRLPQISGQPIRVQIRGSLGPHLAATSIPWRVIALDRDVLIYRGEFERILVHEIFHFVWVRLSNSARRDWELVLEGEMLEGAMGELGWSAEWRKARLRRPDWVNRSAAWRRYACESFCDTAAWRFAGLCAHDEFTLRKRFRHRRGQWFLDYVEERVLSV